MVLWIWIGGGVMVFGMLIALSTPRPGTRRRAAAASERADRPDVHVEV
jgi:cytochrome c biogenesis factor